VVPLIAAYLWIYYRITAESTQSKLDQRSAIVCAWAATIATASLTYFEVRAPWVTIAWAALALLLLVTGWTLRRSLFTAQSLVLLLAAPRAPVQPVLHADFRICHDEFARLLRRARVCSYARRPSVCLSDPQPERRTRT
jgi:hypothetical protein